MHYISAGKSVKSNSQVAYLHLTRDVKLQVHVSLTSLAVHACMHSMTRITPTLPAIVSHKKSKTSKLKTNYKFTNIYTKKLV